MARDRDSIRASILTAILLVSAVGGVVGLSGPIGAAQPAGDATVDAFANGTTNVSVTEYTAEPTTVEIGENVTVTATVANTGNDTNSTTVDVFADGELVANQTVTVGPGNTTNVSAMTSFESAGTHNVSVNDLNATNVTVEEPSPFVFNYSVDNTTVAVNESVTITASANNTGDEAANTTIEFVADGSVFTTADLQVGAGNTSTAAATTNFSTAGSHTVSVNDLDPTNVTVEGESDEEENESEAGPESGPPPADMAAFRSTSSLNPQQVSPPSLSGKLRVESEYQHNTSVNLTTETDTNYTLEITIPNATNVTFFLQSQAVSSSQNISNVSMYLDGQEHVFYVNESAGPGNSPWMLFKIDHFSTRTVSFQSETSTTTGLTLPTFDNAATDTTNDGLLNNVNGDAEFNIMDVVAFHANLDSTVVQDNAAQFNFNGDTDAQGNAQIDVLDVVALFADFQQS